MVQVDDLPGQLAATDGVTGTRSRSQAKAWGSVTGPHEAGGLHLLCSIRPGWVGAAVVLLPYVARVLWALAAAPLSQLHCVGGHLHPPL
jgi:hypothetical protein